MRCVPLTAMCSIVGAGASAGAGVDAAPGFEPGPSGNWANAAFAANPFAARRTADAVRVTRANRALALIHSSLDARDYPRAGPIRKIRKDSCVGSGRSRTKKSSTPKQAPTQTEIRPLGPALPT